MGNRVASSLRRAIALAGVSMVALGAPAHAGAPVASMGDVSPLYGRINPFYGSVGAAYGRINPFYGRINPFYGRINPFYGDVTSYWGRINPFVQDTTTAVAANQDAFWGATNPYAKPMGNGLLYKALPGFWSNVSAAWSPILDDWNAASTPEDATAIATRLQRDLLGPTFAFWNPILAKSGKQGLATQAQITQSLAAAGITLDPNGSVRTAGLLDGDPTQRAMLFLNLYDALMDNAGTAHVDWWMSRTGWSPLLAQIQAKVRPVDQMPTVGMLDLAVAMTVGPDGKPLAGAKLAKQIVQYGSTVFDDGHGAAVGSLIMGTVDGSGVQGVMPAGSVRVLAYDPYDETGTTNWNDVATGITTLTTAIIKDKPTPLGVLNASLGEAGYTLSPGWNTALAGAGARRFNLVVAAGNDGTSQTTNVPWDFANNPNVIIVGSIGADGEISNFSNRPGEACLVPTGSASTICAEENKLKYRFIVAPGEMILVSDGVGGHMRQSGTSLAAPLVSGAIAMLQNRWPWLANYAAETASIVLNSATPRGDQPGADPVYGVGELNIAASQSPLSWGNLVYLQTNNGALPPALAAVAKSSDRTAATWNTIASAGVGLSAVISQQAAGTQASWNASNAAYTVFERVGATYRDFQIPLATKLIGQNVNTLSGGQLYQSYLTAAFRSQIGRFATLGAPAAAGSVFANGFERSSVPAGAIGGMQLRVNVTASAPLAGFRMTNGAAYETGMTLTGTRGAVQFGFGNGASALDTSDSFAFRSDHELGTGGVNPVFGLASGGAYLGGRYQVAPGLAIGIGTTQRSAWRDPVAFGLTEQMTGAWVRRYAAAAQTANLRYAVSPHLIAHASYTHLREQNALLGVQSVSQGDLAGGSTTNAATLGFDLRLKRGITLSATGTLARTGSDGGLLRASGLTGRAAAMAITKDGVFGRLDQLRLLAATPMHTVGGRISYSTVGVVDRTTGEIGLLTQTLDPRADRMPLTGEVMYGRRLPGLGAVSLFGRVQRVNLVSGSTGDALGAMGGAQFRMAF